MTDNILDGLKEADAYSWKWQGKLPFDFGGKICDIDLLVSGNRQTEITERQKEAFRCFMEKWPELQKHLIDSLIKYVPIQPRVLS